MSLLLEQILAPGGLRPVFQPIYRIGAERRLHGIECLIRGPRGTNAESAGVLFEYVRRKRQELAVDRACILAAFREAGRLGGVARLSVNAHVVTLARDPDFPDFLAGAARRHGLDPSALTLELVEHGTALDGPSFSAALAAVRSHGIRVALDDVGVGTSNLRMILECRPDFLKVDRFFVDRGHDDAAKRAVLEGLVHIGRKLGAELVAEGVETRAELETVRALGIDLIQGHLFCTALGIEDLLAHEPSLRLATPEEH